MAEVLTHSKEISLVVYRQQDHPYRETKKSLNEGRVELRRSSLVPTKIYTLGRQTPVSNPDISLEDPYVSRQQATIYVPTSLERIKEGNDYVIFTNIGKNSPSKISLRRGIIRSTESQLINTVVESIEIINRRRDLEHGRATVLYMGEEVSFGPFSIVFTTDSN